MNRRSFLAAGVFAAAAESRRSSRLGIGLLAVAGMLALGGEARGQVGVESDREVLEAFYHATGGPDWFISTDWLSDAPLSDWYGVKTHDDGRVSQLVLQRNNLSGPIPPELPRLTRLANLSLFDNQLNGPIPPELARLTRLERLSLPIGPGAAVGQPIQAPGQPTFRAAVEVIEVAVSVTDANGRPVRDLTADDFEVYEDDRRQPVVAFTHVDTPVEPFDVPVSHPAADAASSGPGERAGRVYLLLLDDLHTHALRTEEVRAIAREFIENTLLANDVAAVALTSGLTPNQPFTSNRQRLLEVVDRFRGLDVRQRLQDPESRPFGGPTKLRMLRTVERMAEWMGRGDARRKAIILVGQGIDPGDSPVGGAQGGETTLELLDAMSRASGVAARHDVTLYAIDPRGLPTGGQSSIQTRFVFGEERFSAAVRREKESLRALAEETGGFALVNSNQFRQAFERVVREQSTYYLLGYRPPRDAPDERLHEIRIRVDRQDVNVRARRSYVHTRLPDEPDDVATRLSALLDSPLPQSGLRLELTGLPLRGDDARAQPVVAAVRVQPPPDGGGALAVDMVVTVIAADTDGTVLARREVEVSLPAELRGAVREHGLRVLSRLDLPEPGRVHLRAAVVDRLAGALGSVHHEMDIPDFRSASIAMSGLAVTSDTPVPTLVAGPGLPSAVPFAPAARRVFDADDTLAVFAELYVNGSRGSRQLHITCAISNDAGEIVFRLPEERLAEDTAAPYRASLPLGDLGPGAYVLSVEAWDEATRARVGREVPFTVR